MQAVILAAGKSTRTYPLTLEKPKPLLEVAGKTILEWNLGSLKEIADEIIIVVGYKKDMVKEFIKKNYPKLNVTFVEQEEQLGTGHAVSTLKGHISGRFLLLMGDNIYAKEDIIKIAKRKYAMLVKKVKKPEFFGVVIEKDGLLNDIIEKPKKFVSNLINCALYSLDMGIFDAIKTVKKSERGEYELTDALKYLSKKESIHCIESQFCILVSYPQDLFDAEKEIRKNKFHT